MTDERKDIRDFLFRGLMFESEASAFEKAGIQVGASSAQAEERLLSEALAPFSIPARNQALEMARLYAVLHCFENSVRELIRETLTEAVGPDWWDKVPANIKKNAENRQKTAFRDTWIEGEKNDMVGFADFGDLAQIIIADHWAHFAPIVPSQHWLKQRMEELEKVRHFVAHNRALLPSEYQRVYMYVADWNRVIGL